MSMPILDSGYRGGGYGTPSTSHSTSRRTTVGTSTKLTNLDTSSDTWGQPIPKTWGVCRVGGRLIWSSKFYNSITEFRVETEHYNTTLNQAYGANAAPLDPSATPPLDVSITTRTGVDISSAQEVKTRIDLAYSFGEEGDTRSERVISKMRINGTLVYDKADGYVAPGLGFNFRYAYDDDTIEANMAKYPDTGKYYYPDQHYITINGFKLEEWGNAVPMDIDAEFALTEQISTPTVTTQDAEVKNPFPGFQYHQTFPNISKRYLYAIYKAPHYMLRVFDLDTGAHIESKDKPITGSAAAMAHFDLQNSYSHVSTFGVAEAMEFILCAQKYDHVIILDCKTGVVTEHYAGSEFLGAINTYSALSTLTDAANKAVFYNRDLVFLNGWMVFEVTPGPTFNIRRIAYPHNSQHINWTGDEKGLGVFTMGFQRNPGVVPGKLVRFDGTNFTEYNLTDDRGYIKPIKAWHFEGHAVMLYQIDGADTVYGGKWSDATGLRVLEKAYPANYYFDTNGETENEQRHTRYPRGYVGIIWGGVDQMHVLNLQTLAITQTALVNGYTSLFDFWDGQALKFAYHERNPFTGDMSTGFGYTVVGAPGRMTLLSLLESLYIESGTYTESQITSDGTIDDMILGAFLNEPGSITGIVENICRLFRIEKQETSTGIYFYRNRTMAGGLTVVATIPITELAIQTTDADIAALETNRMGMAELAGEVELTFIDPSNDYKENKVIGRRVNATAASPKEQVSVPIVMHKKEATSLVENLLNDKKSQRVTHKFRLPPKYNRIQSGDIIKVTNGAYVHTIRITDDDLNADYSVSCSGESVAVTTQIVFEEPVVIDRETSTGKDGAVNSLSYIIDAPLLHYDDIVPDGNFTTYLVLNPESTEAWAGGYLARQVEDDDYATLYNVGSQAITRVLTCQTVLTNKRWVVDSDQLSASFVAGSWTASDTKTDAEVQADRRLNLAFYGKPGRWEIVQFAGITDNKIHGIVRGLRGTEVFAGLHEVGDLFIIVKSNDSGVIAEDRPNTEIGKTERYKAVSIGQYFSLIEPSDDRVIEGNSIKPFAPSNVQCDRLEGGDVVVTWDRRDRRESGWGAATLPMSEASESYRLWVEDGIGNIVRTWLTSEKTITYPYADQVTDLTSEDTELYIRVAQIGATGPGFSEVKLCPLT